MTEYKCPVKNGFLKCKEYKKGLEVTEYKGDDIHLKIPSICVQADKPILSIGKKALLSCKNIQSIRLEDQIEEIGDWAFAYCDELREVFLPRKNLTFGRGIFQECPKLQAVHIAETHPDVGGLMAAAVTLLDAPFLFHPLRAGDEEWVRQWDVRMLQLLHRKDREGFSKMLLCGEEDYGSKENNLDYYINQKRKSKVRIAFMRLLHPLGIQEEVKEELISYLQEHTAGKESEESWQVLHKEFGNDSAYYKLFAEIGCLTEDNFDQILREIGNEYPEMKAFFMRYKEEKLGYTDFFENLCI